MTEQEAKTKWCPKYQVCGYEPADNRPWKGGTGEPPAIGEIDTRVAGCIGSACMAWRWEGMEQAHLPPGEEPQGTGWAKGALWDDGRYQQWERRSQGFCGLAGKP